LEPSLAAARNVDWRRHMNLASSLQAPARRSRDAMPFPASTDAVPFPCDEECPSMRDPRADPPSLLHSNSQVLIAQRTAALWRAVDGELSPVIGRRATEALHRRALFLARANLAWLPQPKEHDTLEDCLAQLSSALATRSVDEARLAMHALELGFHDLLASLIGPSLTTQLLRSAWSLHSGPDAADSGSR
jgi:hypothetical protein